MSKVFLPIDEAFSVESHLADMVVSGGLEVGDSAPDLPIQKKVLHAGRGDLPKFTNGTKVLILRILMSSSSYICSCC